MERCFTSRFAGAGHNSCPYVHQEIPSRGNTTARQKFAQQADQGVGCHTKRRQHSLQSYAIAEPSSKSQTSQQGLNIEIDNDAEETSTVVKVSGLNKPGLLSALTKKMQNLGLEVVKVALGSLQGLPP